MCVYCYHIIKSLIQEKKIVKLVIIQAFDWLSKLLKYYLCINEYGYMDQ